MYVYYALYVKQSAYRSAEGWWSIWRLMDDRIRHSRRGENLQKYAATKYLERKNYIKYICVGTDFFKFKQSQGGKPAKIRSLKEKII